MLAMLTIQPGSKLMSELIEGDGTLSLEGDRTLFLEGDPTLFLSLYQLKFCIGFTLS
jgi:hypothetical protein